MNFSNLYWGNRSGRRLEGAVRKTLKLGKRPPPPWAPQPCQETGLRLSPRERDAQPLQWAGMQIKTTRIWPLSPDHIDKNKNSDKIKRRLGCGEVATLTHCRRVPATLEGNSAVSFYMNAVSPSTSTRSSQLLLWERGPHIPRSIPTGLYVHHVSKRTDK